MRVTVDITKANAFATAISLERTDLKLSSFVLDDFDSLVASVNNILTQINTPHDEISDAIRVAINRWLDNPYSYTRSRDTRQKNLILDFMRCIALPGNCWENFLSFVRINCAALEALGGTTTTTTTTTTAYESSSSAGSSRSLSPFLTVSSALASSASSAASTSSSRSASPAPVSTDQRNDVLRFAVYDWLNKHSDLSVRFNRACQDHLQELLKAVVVADAKEKKRGSIQLGDYSYYVPDVGFTKANERSGNKLDRFEFLITKKMESPVKKERAGAELALTRTLQMYADYAGDSGQDQVCPNVQLYIKLLEKVLRYEHGNARGRDAARSGQVAAIKAALKHLLTNQHQEALVGLADVIAAIQSSNSTLRQIALQAYADINDDVDYITAASQSRTLDQTIKGRVSELLQRGKASRGLSKTRLRNLGDLKQYAQASQNKKQAFSRNNGISPLPNSDLSTAARKMYSALWRQLVKTSMTRSERKKLRAALKALRKGFKIGIHQPHLVRIFSIYEALEEEYAAVLHSRVLKGSKYDARLLQLEELGKALDAQVDVILTAGDSETIEYNACIEAFSKVEAELQQENNFTFSQLHRVVLREREHLYRANDARVDHSSVLSRDALVIDDNTAEFLAKEWPTLSAWERRKVRKKLLASIKANEAGAKVIKTIWQKLDLYEQIEISDWLIKKFNDAEVGNDSAEFVKGLWEVLPKTVSEKVIKLLIKKLLKPKPDGEMHRATSIKSFAELIAKQERIISGEQRNQVTALVAFLDALIEGRAFDSDDIKALDYDDGVALTRQIVTKHIEDPDQFVKVVKGGFLACYQQWLQAPKGQAVADDQQQPVDGAPAAAAAPKPKSDPLVIDEAVANFYRSITAENFDALAKRADFTTVFSTKGPLVFNVAKYQQAVKAHLRVVAGNYIENRIEAAQTIDDLLKILEFVQSAGRSNAVNYDAYYEIGNEPFPVPDGDQINQILAALLGKAATECDIDKLEKIIDVLRDLPKKAVSCLYLYILTPEIEGLVGQYVFRLLEDQRDADLEKYFPESGSGGVGDVSRSGVVLTFAGQEFTAVQGVLAHLRQFTADKQPTEFENAFAWLQKIERLCAVGTEIPLVKGFIKRYQDSLISFKAADMVVAAVKQGFVFSFNNIIYGSHVETFKRFLAATSPCEAGLFSAQDAVVSIIDSNNEIKTSISADKEWYGIDYAAWIFLGNNHVLKSQQVRAFIRAIAQDRKEFPLFDWDMVRDVNRNQRYGYLNKLVKAMGDNYFKLELAEGDNLKLINYKEGDKDYGKTSVHISVGDWDDVISQLMEDVNNEGGNDFSFRAYAVIWLIASNMCSSERQAKLKAQLVNILKFQQHVAHVQTISVDVAAVSTAPPSHISEANFVACTAEHNQMPQSLWGTANTMAGRAYQQLSPAVARAIDPVQAEADTVMDAARNAIDDSTFRLVMRMRRKAAELEAPKPRGSSKEGDKRRFGFDKHEKTISGAQRRAQAQLDALLARFDNRHRPLPLSCFLAIDPADIRWMIIGLTEKERVVFRRELSRIRTIAHDRLPNATDWPLFKVLDALIKIFSYATWFDAQLEFDNIKEQLKIIEQWQPAMLMQLALQLDQDNVKDKEALGRIFKFTKPVDRAVLDNVSKALEFYARAQGKGVAKPALLLSSVKIPDSKIAGVYEPLKSRRLAYVPLERPLARLQKVAQVEPFAAVTVDDSYGFALVAATPDQAAQRRLVGKRGDDEDLGLLGNAELKNAYDQAQRSYEVLDGFLARPAGEVDLQTVIDAAKYLRTHYALLDAESKVRLQAHYVKVFSTHLLKPLPVALARNQDEPCSESDHAVLVRVMPVIAELHKIDALKGSKLCEKSSQILQQLIDRYVRDASEFLLRTLHSESFVFAGSSVDGDWRNLDDKTDREALIKAVVAAYCMVKAFAPERLQEINQRLHVVQFYSLRHAARNPRNQQTAFRYNMLQALSEHCDSIALIADEKDGQRQAVTLFSTPEKRRQRTVKTRAKCARRYMEKSPKERLRLRGLNLAAQLDAACFNLFLQDSLKELKASADAVAAKAVRSNGAEAEAAAAGAYLYECIALDPEKALYDLYHIELAGMALVQNGKDKAALTALFKRLSRFETADPKHFSQCQAADVFEWRIVANGRLPEALKNKIARFQKRRKAMGEAYQKADIDASSTTSIGAQQNIEITFAYIEALIANSEITDIDWVLQDARNELHMLELANNENKDAIVEIDRRRQTIDFAISLAAVLHNVQKQQLDIAQLLLAPECGSLYFCDALHKVLKAFKNQVTDERRSVTSERSGAILDCVDRVITAVGQGKFAEVESGLVAITRASEEYVGARIVDEIKATCDAQQASAEPFQFHSELIDLFKSLTTNGNPEQCMAAIDWVHATVLHKHQAKNGDKAAGSLIELVARRVSVFIDKVAALEKDKLAASKVGYLQEKRQQWSHYLASRNYSRVILELGCFLKDEFQVLREASITEGDYLDVLECALFSLEGLLDPLSIFMDDTFSNNGVRSITSRMYKNEVFLPVAKERQLGRIRDVYLALRRKDGVTTAAECEALLRVINKAIEYYQTKPTEGCIRSALEWLQGRKACPDDVRVAAKNLQETTIGVADDTSKMLAGASVYPDKRRPQRSEVTGKENGVGAAANANASTGGAAHVGGGVGASLRVGAGH